MYKFDQGITFILDKLQLREELLRKYNLTYCSLIAHYEFFIFFLNLDFYMEKNDNAKVLEICKKFG